MLCGIAEGCGTQPHRVPLPSLSLCRSHDWWHQFRGGFGAAVTELWKVVTLTLCSLCNPCKRSLAGAAGSLKRLLRARWERSPISNSFARSGIRTDFHRTTLFWKQAVTSLLHGFAFSKAKPQKNFSESLRNTSDWVCGMIAKTPHHRLAFPGPGPTQVAPAQWEFQVGPASGTLLE